jgi:pre-rRNA-processing protein TSR1
MGGRVNAKGSTGSAAVARSKADRRHMIQQKRAASRQALLQKKRRGVAGGSFPTPRVVGIISLGESQEIEEKLRTLLVKGADHVSIAGSTNRATITAKYNVHKKDGALTFLTNAQAFGPHYAENGDDGAVLAALDLCRVCDAVLFVVDGNGPDPDADVLGMHIGADVSSAGTHKSTAKQNWDHLISRRGDRILAAVKGQGLPTPLTVLAHTAKDQPDEDFMTMQSAKSVRRSALKRSADLKHYISRFATTEFGPEKDKVVEVDLTVLEADNQADLMEAAEENPAAVRQKQAEAVALVRTLCTMAARPPKWIADAPRSYLLSDSHEYDAAKEELRLTGYLRGQVPFDVNALIHVPNLGTFVCQSVQKAQPPFRERRGDSKMEEVTILYSDPNKRESLERFAAPDALDGEQNLVGFDEAFAQALEETDTGGKDVERPAGWSDYQSAWLDAVDEMGGSEDEMDHGELARALNQRRSGSGDSVATGIADMDEDNEISAEEKNALLAQRRKAQKEDLEFPDEVEVPEDVNARDRFARYRSLKSFRKSFWDPKENLPDSYGSIYHFSSFKATQRDVMADMKDRASAAEAADGYFWGGSCAGGIEVHQQTMQEDSDEEEDDILDGCVPSGAYVTLTLEKVARDAFDSVSGTGVLSAVTLLPHENKVSALHMGLSQASNCEQDPDLPVKSKDILTFRCGWRTWKARPVFSQNNLNSDKHKFERFLPQDGAFFAASIFGPVTYTPCPVLVFRERSRGVNSICRELLAVGSMIGADADRIVVKRIILTGYPVRVHKRYATVKYMFYNPEDVKWFKPAGLSTKHGLHGHITQSVGEHGTMKCLFNAPIKQHDTVCLPLYKRIYPKFAPKDSKVADDGTTIRTSGDRTSLAVL